MSRTRSKAFLGGRAMPEDFKPHENFYLVSTHHEFLMSQTADAINASRIICRELMAELQAGQVKPARAIEQPSLAPRRKANV